MSVFLFLTTAIWSLVTLSCFSSRTADVSFLVGDSRWIGQPMIPTTLGPCCEPQMLGHHICMTMNLYMLQVKVIRQDEPLQRVGYTSTSPYLYALSYMGSAPGLRYIAREGASTAITKGEGTLVHSWATHWSRDSCSAFLEWCSKPPVMCSVVTHPGRHMTPEVCRMKFRNGMNGSFNPPPYLPYLPYLPYPYPYPLLHTRDGQD